MTCLLPAGRAAAQPEGLPPSPLMAPPPPFSAELPPPPPAAAGPREGILAPAPLVAPPPVAPPPAAPPPPYSLPWGLRPAIPVTVLRLDSVVATYKPADSTGVTTAVLPLAGYRFTPQFMGVARWGIIGNAAPDGSSGVSVTNLALGGIYGIKLPAGLRLAFFLGVTVPIGTGGAKAADPLTFAANQAGLYARSALDNAMFAVNDLTVFPGIDLAYVGRGWTVQAELTVLQLMRVKNEAVQTDAFRTNFTTGLHVGYFVTRWLTLSTELRYQRWLSTPDAVAADEGLRHNLSLAVGPRFHVKTPRGWLRPGLAYAPGLAGRMITNNYHMLLIDIPHVF